MEAFYGAPCLSSPTPLILRSAYQGKNEGASIQQRYTKREIYFGGRRGIRESWPTAPRAPLAVAIVIVRRSLSARTLRRNIAILRKFDRFCRRRR